MVRLPTLDEYKYLLENFTLYKTLKRKGIIVGEDSNVLFIYNSSYLTVDYINRLFVSYRHFYIFNSPPEYFFRVKLVSTEPRNGFIKLGDIYWMVDDYTDKDNHSKFTKKDINFILKDVENSFK